MSDSFSVSQQPTSIEVGYQTEPGEVVSKQWSCEEIGRVILGVFLCIISACILLAVPAIMNLFHRMQSTPENTIDESKSTAPVGKKLPHRTGVAPEKSIDEHLFENMDFIKNTRYNELKDGAPPTENGVKIYVNNGSLVVFSLEGYPGSIFKMSLSEWGVEGIKDRVKNSQIARGVCIEKGLDRLVIPETRLYEFGSEVILQQQKLDFVEDQNSLHKEDDPTMDKAIKQLAVLTCETKFSDAHSLNTPYLGDGRIGIIDLEDINGPTISWSLQLLDNQYGDRQKTIIEAVAETYDRRKDRIRDDGILVYAGGPKVAAST